jgi:hypothetical protein
VQTSPDRDAERAVAASAAALGLDCRLVACAYSLNGSHPLALELLAGEREPVLAGGLRELLSAAG